MKPFLWNILDQFGSQIINLVLSLIMLRFLTPNDYGLFVIPFLIYNLLKTFQDLGSHDLIFRSAAFDIQFLKQILGFTLIISFLIIAIALVLPINFFALISNSFQTDKDYFIKLIPLLTFTGFNLSLEYYCRKTLQFNITAISNLSSTFLAGIFGIYLAKNGFNTDSLLYKQILFVVLYFGFAMILTKGILFPSFSVKSVWKERDFFLPLFTSQILAFGSRNLDNLFIGKYLGVEKLGLYDRAYKFLSTPLGQIGGTFHRVILPVLTKLSPDKTKMLEVFSNFLFLISLIIFPFLFLLAALAKEFVLLFFGSAWIEAIPIIQIFSIAACYQSIGGINYGIILLDNKTKYYKNLMIIFNILYFIIFILFTRFIPNLKLLVLCYSIATLFFNIYIFNIAAKYFRISLYNLVKIISIPLFLSSLLTAHLLFIKTILEINSFSRFILVAFLSLMLYFYLYLTFFKKNYIQLKSFIIKSNFLDQTS